MTSVVGKLFDKLNVSRESIQEKKYLAHSLAHEEESVTTKDFMEDGNKDHYTEEAIAERQKLRDHENIVAWLKRYHSTFTSAKSAHGGFGTLERAEVLAVQVKMCKALFAPDEFVFSEAALAVEADWEREVGPISDPKTPLTMSREKFYDSLFEIADVWTMDICDLEYTNFLAALYYRISEPKRDKHGNIIKGQRRWVATDKILSLQDDGSGDGGSGDGAGAGTAGGDTSASKQRLGSNSLGSSSWRRALTKTFAVSTIAQLSGVELHKGKAERNRAKIPRWKMLPVSFLMAASNGSNAGGDKYRGNAFRAGGAIGANGLGSGAGGGDPYDDKDAKDRYAGSAFRAGGAVGAGGLSAGGHSGAGGDPYDDKGERYAGSAFRAGGAVGAGDLCAGGGSGAGSDPYDDKGDRYGGSAFRAGGAVGANGLGGSGGGGSGGGYHDSSGRWIPSDTAGGDDGGGRSGGDAYNDARSGGGPNGWKPTGSTQRGDAETMDWGPYDDGKDRHGSRWGHLGSARRIGGGFGRTDGGSDAAGGDGPNGWKPIGSAQQGSTESMNWGPYDDGKTRQGSRSGAAGGGLGAGGGSDTGRGVGGAPGTGGAPETGGAPGSGEATTGGSGRAFGGDGALGSGGVSGGGTPSGVGAPSGDDTPSADRLRAGSIGATSNESARRLSGAKMADEERTAVRRAEEEKRANEAKLANAAEDDMVRARTSMLKAAGVSERSLTLHAAGTMTKAVAKLERMQRSSIRLAQNALRQTAKRMCNGDLTQLFEKLDRDGSGTIDADELRFGVRHTLQVRALQRRRARARARRWRSRAKRSAHMHAHTMRSACSLRIYALCERCSCS